VFTLGGISGIASSVVIWRGFLAEFFSIYSKVVREPLSSLVTLVLPVAWWPPDWIYDVAVIWGFTFATIRLFLLFEGETATIQRRALRKWWSYPIMFVLGPLSPFYLVYVWLHLLVREHLMLVDERMADFRGIEPLSRIGKIALLKREDALVAVSQNLLRDTQRLALYFAGMLTLVLLMLMINYQFWLPDV
jgi:hypothetical protein